MCIKLAYLRSLVKSAARKFCLRKSSDHESFEKNHYFKNELFETKETDKQSIEIVESISMEVPEDALDNRARTMIEEIAQRAELAEHHVISAFESWKSMKDVKKCTDIPFEVLINYCVYFVAERKLFNRGGNNIFNFGEVDQNYCYSTIDNWMFVKRSICFELLAYPKEVPAAAVAFAARVFGDWHDLDDREKRIELIEKACEVAKEQLEELILKDVQLFELQQQENTCDIDTAKALIDEIFTTAELPESHKEKSFLLWRDLKTAKSYRTKDIRAQAAGAIYAVCLFQFQNREIAHYANAPESHLGRCQKMAIDWRISKGSILGACQEYSLEMELCASDIVLSVMGGQVNYRCGDPRNLAVAALYITFKKHGLQMKIEGKFLSISFTQPHFRVPAFYRIPNWNVEVAEFGDSFHYYIYICRLQGADESEMTANHSVRDRYAAIAPSWGRSLLDSATEEK